MRRFLRERRLVVGVRPLSRWVTRIALIAVVAIGVPTGVPADAATGDAGHLYAAGTEYCALTYGTHPRLAGFGPSVDINAVGFDLGREVFAPADGIVTIESVDGDGQIWGNSIIWTSSDGVESIHVAHLMDVVQVGVVSGGDLIGHAGNTGSTVGPPPDNGAHLHVGRMVNGKPAPLVLSGEVIHASASNPYSPNGTCGYVSEGPTN
jgi:murein DD-endopeptidase MepM/ murein hydrolase activator NlpD